MKEKGLVILGILIGILLTVAFLSNGSTGQVQAGVNGAPAITTPTPGAALSDEGGPAASLQSDAGNDEIPPAGNAPAALGPNFVLPTQIPGETTVYFVPTDNDATATVLYLYNTDSVAHVVALRGFNYDGAMVYAQNINIGASSFLRLVSDSVASAPPPSWATPAPITTNFTDFVYFASLSLAKGVKVEGYTLFNPGTGVVNPRLDQGAIPLRFSTDPATVFLPSVQAGP
jgi:hypothetical protein